MTRSIGGALRHIGLIGLLAVQAATMAPGCTRQEAATGGSGGTQGTGGQSSQTGGGGAAGTIGTGGTGGALGTGGMLGTAGTSASGGAIGSGGSTTTGGSGVAGAAAGGRVGGTGGAAATGGTGVVVTPTGPYPTQACLDRANTLLAQMTPDEKYAQLMQMERAATTPALVTQYGVGSVFSQGGSGPTPNTPTGWANMADGYRQAGLASRLKIPVIYGVDNVHGAGTVPGATVFPHNIGLGATRNLALVQQVASVTAEESAGCGQDFPFAPVLAVARDERWGRTYEAFGETTDLVTMMGEAQVRGFQFSATGAPTGILANVKHFLGDGGTAMGKNGGVTSGTEAALRALHLEPYRAAVAARAGSMMASYNTWQTTEMHLNKTMITDVLKGEMKFGGFMLSDFNACFQLGLADREGISGCLNAGIDMFMVYQRTIPVMVGHVAALVQAGTVPAARVDDAVRRIVAVKCEMGLFNAGTGLVNRTLTAQVGSPAHRMVARQAVRESLVVLKNAGNVLPLPKTGHIALGGKSADNTGNQCGGWTITWQGATGNVVPGATSVRAAFEAVLGTTGVTYAAGAPSATGSTVGVAVIGETPYSEGTGDRTDLALAAADIAVVQAMKTAGLKVVVVLIAGRPMILDSILALADAVVMAWLPGSEGAGITDVLFGDAHPTGKLPHSWPRTMAQIPINQGDATYDPLFPFGFGLTY